MARYTQESLERLKSRVDLIEVVGKHIDLKRAGASYKALCPFHDEKTPSFQIQKGANHYHCFGCAAHGDAIAFLMEYLRMSFSEAVQSLAEQFHVELEIIAGEKDEKKINKSKIKDVIATAASFYNSFLQTTEEGKVALAYLFDRGMDSSFINSFQIGWAPRQEGIFTDYMKSRSFDVSLLEESGLLVRRGLYLREFFNERVSFPILDIQGAPIGFSARKIREEVFGGKYINTQETVIFKKSRLLFGLYQCRRRIAKEKQALIVEGQIDALRLIHAGFDFTVAALGTAFGADHVDILARLGVTQVYLLFDGDAAGQQAAAKVGQLFQKEGIGTKVATLGLKEDPDSLLLKEGPVAIAKKINEAKEYLAFLYDFHSHGASSLSPSEKSRIVKTISDQISEWKDPILVHETLKKLASLASIPDDLIASGPQMGAMKVEKSHQIDPDRILETDFLRLLLLNPEKENLKKLAKSNIASSDLKSPIPAKCYEQFLLCNESLDLLSLAQFLDEEELSKFFDELHQRKINKERSEELLGETIGAIKKRNWMIDCDTVAKKIHSGTLSEDEVKACIKTFDGLKRSPPKVIFA